MGFIFCRFRFCIGRCDLGNGDVVVRCRVLPVVLVRMLLPVVDKDDGDMEADLLVSHCRFVPPFGAVNDRR
jgi:hypothetical protein